MLVSFLQALLNMLRKELDSFGGPDVDESKPLAESVAEAVQLVAGENGGTQKPAGDAGPANSPARPAANNLPPADKQGRSRRSRRKR
jgi:hypothetical protein